ncbi:UPF0220 domain protein [Rutstroemia sp. NJR-2017a WRK4]|nr:UPF0220 domain protein [Rutstroemia sp. NJR-2017a WRK4]
MPPAPQRASSHPTTTTSTSTSHPSTRTSVRRNLFQSQLSRRGGGDSQPSSHTHSRSTSQSSLSHHRPTTSSTSTSAETLRLDIDLDVNRMGPEPTDIVIRDKNGDFEVLAMQSLEDDDDSGGGGGGGGFRGLGEEGEEGERKFFWGWMDGWEGRANLRLGVDERQRLADAVKHHQRDRNRAPSEPAELYEAVRASLRAKTAALAEDNWMFEAEPETVIR